MPPMPRFRPRFSIRTLAIVVTLVCAYFGAWEATKRHGISDMGADPLGEVESPMPFIVRQDEIISTDSVKYATPRRYYFWFFGAKIKLPYETTWDVWAAMPDPPLTV